MREPRWSGPPWLRALAWHGAPHPDIEFSGTVEQIDQPQDVSSVRRAATA